MRVDASRTLGAGHVMRSLALAAELRDAGADVQFACATLDGLATELIKPHGFPIAEPQGAFAEPPGAFDWAVADHYELDAAWESRARQWARRVLAVDDLANRRHDADVLVDQNHYTAMERRYDELVPAHCERLLGPAYAMLRPQFARARSSVSRTGAVRRVLVSFGATDPKAQTPLAAEALRRLQLEMLLPKPGEDMATLMAQADLAVGAGGVTTNERMCMGLPAVVVATHPTQEASARDVAALGAHRYAGRAEEMDAGRYAQTLAELAARPDLLRRMAAVGMRNVDGLGARRVARRMLEP